jgi:acyl-coenzyme A synthetase/AMP-(fatty) acid ligase
MAQYRFIEAFLAAAKSYHDRTAIQTRHVSLSYAGLVAEVSQTAHLLMQRGVRPDSHVGITARDNKDVLILSLACWMIGATIAPVDFKEKSGALEAIVSSIDLTVLICDEGRGHKNSQNLPSIELDDYWRECVARHSKEPLFASSENSLAIIKLTSGTTGKKLGIVYNHDRFLLAIMSRIKEDGGGRFLNALPMSFSMSFNNTVSQLLTGGTVIFFPPLFSGKELAEAILSLNVTSALTVPLVIRQLLAVVKEETHEAFPNLVQLRCGGEPLAPSDKKRAYRLLSRGFTEFYSCTMTGQISQLRGQDILDAPDSVGRILPGVLLEIVDENDRPLPAGSAGRIRMRGPGMATGFYGDVQRSSGDRSFNGWLYTGDLGQADTAGFLRLAGRESELVIRGGEKIRPLQIEGVGADLKGVVDIAVVGYASEREGENLAAFIVAEEFLTKDQVIAHFRSRLPPTHCPRKIRFVKDLPRNTNGKVIKEQLADLLAENAGHTSAV